MRSALSLAAVAWVAAACAATQHTFLNDDPTTGGACGNGDQEATRCGGSRGGWWCCPSEYACGVESPDGTDGECDPASPELDPNSGQFSGGDYGAALKRGDAGKREPIHVKVRR